MLGITNFARHLTGQIDVRETKQLVIITGIQTRKISELIQKYWTTSKIAKFMFVTVSAYEIKIPSFFALEFLFILRTLQSTRQTAGYSRAISTTINGLMENTWIKDLQSPMKPWLNWEAMEDGMLFKPLPHQQIFFQKYEETKVKYGLRGMMLSAPAGSGKAQPMYSKIHTPDGWKTMGEMKIGTVVSTPDGNSGIVNGVYPQGKKDIYELTFVDGRKTRACGEHLWRFIDGNADYSENPTKVKTTLEIKERIETSTKRNHFIPLIGKVTNKANRLPIDPYILGVLLGDGSFRQNRIVFSTPENHIVEEFKKQLGTHFKVEKIPSSDISYSIVGLKRGHNDMLTTIRGLELGNKYSYEKHIPDMYIDGSYEQRLQILQGLMDTDGYVDTQSTVSFCTTSKVMAEQVQYLIRSVGGIARISEKNPKFTYKGEKKQGRIAYNINIRHPKPSILFRLPRKKERCNDNGQYCGKVLKLAIKSIEFIGVEEAQCISIDHPDHLYITDDFIVTHNTYMDISIALGVGATKTIIICPKNANYRVWEKTLMQEMKVPQHPFIGDRDPVLQPEKQWHIFHYEQLERAIELVSKWNVRQEKICIILDESHNFNDMKSLRTERFLTLCQMSESNDIIWASGTPVKALGTETIPLIKCIDPKFDARAEEAFKKMYGRDASRTLDILNHRLGIISFTVPKTQVMQDEPVIEQINVQMPNSDKYTLEFLSKVMKDFITERSAFYDKVRPEAIEYYRGIMNAFEKTLAPNETEAYRKYQECVRTLMTVSFDARQHGELAVYTNKYEKEVILPRIPQVERNKFKDIKSVVKYPLLKVRGECLGRILTNERVQCHVDMLKYIDFEKLISNVEKKTIIFTSYVTVVDACADLLKLHKYKPLKVYGATNNELPKIVGVFEKDATANPLIATFQSLSTAVPLTMANGIIMLNANWRSYEREQAIARAHRIGQDRTVYVFDIILDTGDKVNISSRSLDIMKWSQEQVDAITGIKGDINITMESNELPVIVSGDVNDIVDDVCFSEDDLGDVERSVNTLVQQERISVSLPEQESSEPTDVALSSSFEKLFNKDGSRAD